MQGLQPRLARDVRITTVAGVTTYAQVVEKALTTKSAENKIWRDSAARKDVTPWIAKTDTLCICKGAGLANQANQLKM